MHNPVRIVHLHSQSMNGLADHPLCLPVKDVHVVHVHHGAAFDSDMRSKTAELVYLLGDTLAMGQVVFISPASEAGCCQIRRG
jgi:hypothetical protein